MARFDKLEWDDDNAPGIPEPRESSGEKDEHHWFAMAEKQRRDGLHENALRFYSRTLEVNRSLVEAWVAQVQMLVILGEYPQAITWSQKALELFPSQGDLLASQAQANCRLGDFKSASSLSDASLKQRGETAYQWQVRGEVMVATRQKNDRHCFDRAQILSQDFLVPLESALIYIYHRAFVKAQQRARAALDRQPDSHFAWLTLGRCQEESGMTDAAIQSYEHCLEMHPNHSEATQRLSQLRQSGWSVKQVFRRLFTRE